MIFDILRYMYIACILHFSNAYSQVYKMHYRPRGYNTFSYSTQLSTKFILLIYVKMPTVVGILTFISMINTTSEIH